MDGDLHDGCFSVNDMRQCLEQTELSRYFVLFGFSFQSFHEEDENITLLIVLRD